MLCGCILVGFGCTAVSLSLAGLASMSDVRIGSSLRDRVGWLICEGDPAVGTLYRWAAASAPFAPRFQGVLQGRIEHVAIRRIHEAHTVTYTVNGSDEVLHISIIRSMLDHREARKQGILDDEVKKVKTRLPRSIIVSAVISSIMLFAFIICLLFTIGNVDKVTASLSTTSVPLVDVFREATKSKHATNFLVSMPAIVLLYTIFNVFASISRLIGTFARDKGLPFSRRCAYRSPSHLRSTASRNSRPERRGCAKRDPSLHRIRAVG